MNFKKYSDEEKSLRKQLIISLKKDISIAEVASNLLGLTVIKTNKTNSRYLRTAEHGSLLLDMRSNYAIWNAITGRKKLNCIELYMEYTRCSGTEACDRLIEYYLERNPKQIDLFMYDVETDESYEYKGLQLPSKAKNNDRVLLYLTERRGLNENLVNRLIDEGKIYQDTYNNAVFVDFDVKEGQIPCFAFRNGTQEIAYQRDIFGSFKMNGFFIENNKKIQKLVLCGSIIDGMSYATLCYRSKKDHHLDAHILCSTEEGSALSTLVYNLQNNPSLKYINQIEVLMGFDDVGKYVSNQIADYFSNKYKCHNDLEYLRRCDIIKKFPELFDSQSTKERIQIDKGKSYKILSYGNDIEFGKEIEKSDKHFIEIDNIKSLNDIVQNIALVTKRKEEQDIFQEESQKQNFEEITI